MNLLTKLSGMLSLSALMAAAPALSQQQNDCPVAFTAESQTVTLLAANIGSGQRAVGERAVRVAAIDQATDFRPCDVELRVSRLQTDPSFPAYSLRILGTPITPSVSDAVGRSQNQIRVQVPASPSGRPININASAPSNWGLKAGQYTEKLQLSLVGNGGIVLDRLALDIVFDVPKVADVMFVGATGRGRTSRIDLGVLSSTATTFSEPFGFRVWSSSGYSVELSSQNAGQLAHSQNMDAIPYNLEVDGRTVQLSGAPAPFVRQTHTSADGDIYLLNLTVPARRSVAGEYEDRIMVSVSTI